MQYEELAELARICAKNSFLAHSKEASAELWRMASEYAAKAARLDGGKTFNRQPSGSRCLHSHSLSRGENKKPRIIAGLRRPSAKGGDYESDHLCRKAFHSSFRSCGKRSVAE